MRLCSNFTDFHLAVQLSQHHSLRRRSFFSIVYIWFLYARLTGCGCVGLLLGCLFCSVHPEVCSCPSTTVVLMTCSVVLPEFWGGLCLLTYSVLRISLAILGHLWFHIKFSIIGSSSGKKKKSMGILIEIAVKYVDLLG